MTSKSSEKDLTPEGFARMFLKSVKKAVKDGNADELVEFIHPSGILLSPDAFVDVEKDVRLGPDEFLKAWKENEKFVWGYQPGSGMPIEMGIRDYFRRYVYDRDYLNAPEVSTDKAVGKSNTKNNIKEVFSKATFVEFHFPGKGEFDWSSLRVVLQREGENWKVVAVVRDGWTP